MKGVKKCYSWVVYRRITCYEDPKVSGWLSPGMLRHLDLPKLTYVSDMLTASIIRAVMMETGSDCGAVPASA
jgi:hypothetical protein